MGESRSRQTAARRGCCGVRRAGSSVGASVYGPEGQIESSPRETASADRATGLIRSPEQAPEAVLGFGLGRIRSVNRAGGLCTEGGE